MLKVKVNKNEYTKVLAKKTSMSQVFDQSSMVVPVTILKISDSSSLDLFEGFDATKSVKVSGLAKGRGFAGVMKRWGFSGGPKTHGQSDKTRSGGSIGTQGQGRVIPGKKMAGRMGGNKVTVKTKIINVNKDKNEVMVKGAVPGSRSSEVVILLPVS